MDTAATCAKGNVLYLSSFGETVPEIKCTPYKFRTTYALCMLKL